ncbi:MAG: hypothetical protein MUP49_05620 [Dehalococcoidia bacterium]|nr:hypothetical protein [Dehalococcoidia bacterium]
MTERSLNAYSSPVDVYITDPTRTAIYVEKTKCSGTVFNNQMAYLCMNIPASGVVSGFACGLVIDWTIGASATVSAVRHIYLYADLGVAHTDTDASFIRFEDNGSTYWMEALLEYQGPSNTAKGTDYFFYSGVNVGNCVSYNGALSLVQSGWLRCKIGSSVRYISLYSS